jgi:hypothetical protein
MQVAKIEERVDRALQDNRRAETIFIGMTGVIFVAGIASLAVAYWLKNPYIGGGGVLLNGFLYGPLNAIRKLRKENIVLQVLPVMIAQLPPKEAVNELQKFLAQLRDKK